MVADLAERQTEASQDTELDELTFNFSVEVVYNAASPALPIASFTSGPTSGTAFVSQNTAAIILSITEITGPFRPSEAAASFTGVLTWFHLGGTPTSQPSNVSISVTQAGQVLTIGINSNPASATHPHVVGFKAQLSCTATGGPPDTVTIETPDPTIVYVQPPG